MEETKKAVAPKKVEQFCEVCHCLLVEVGGYDWTGMCYKCAHEEAHFGHEDDERRDD